MGQQIQINNIGHIHFSFSSFAPFSSRTKTNKGFLRLQLKRKERPAYSSVVSVESLRGFLCGHLYLAGERPTVSKSACLFFSPLLIIVTCQVYAAVILHLSLGAQTKNKTPTVRKEEKKNQMWPII